MTMAEGTDLIPPLAVPDDQDPSYSLYGFKIDKWLDHPVPNGRVDWFPAEERCRRDANAYAYRQTGTKENWYRNLLLGFYVFEDCHECDKVWASIDQDPLQVHRSIWYNFQYHVDQSMDIPPKLNAWAMNITSVYLAHFDLTTLHGTDTLAYSWKTMPFSRTSMEIDDQSAWILATGRKRSKSPPNAPIECQTSPENGSRSVAPGFNLPPDDIPNRAHIKLTVTESEPLKPPELKKPRKQQLSWSHGLPKVMTVTEANDDLGEETQTNTDKYYSDLASNNTGKSKSKAPPHPHIPINDGTYRINVKWTPLESTQEYERDKKKLNDAIYAIVKELFPDTVGMIYRWESEDLIFSNHAKNMTSTEIRDCITPSITIAHSQSQIIFGVRFGFTNTLPGVWLRSTPTKVFLKSHKIEVTISNSKSTSGKMVTAGYVLLKAPNTTQVHRYTQFLRQILPENTPYFDVLRYIKTPMDQLIPHLVIQCGEKHVAPLCQALLPVMTGRGIAMFIPRYAFSTMTSENIRNHFTFHEKWSKSLKAIPMSPHINHLDQVRTEYNDDGTTTERSTREWVATILAPDGSNPALCDVVNGPPDHKAYLLVPSHYLVYAQNQWREYKARLSPPTHREARYRDNLPGLPNVIHIQAAIASNVTFLKSSQPQLSGRMHHRSRDTRPTHQQFKMLANLNKALTYRQSPKMNGQLCRRHLRPVDSTPITRCRCDHATPAKKTSLVSAEQEHH
jgi:hypothetical protein